MRGGCGSQASFLNPICPRRSPRAPAPAWAPPKEAASPHLLDAEVVLEQLLDALLAQVGVAAGVQQALLSHQQRAGGFWGRGGGRGAWEG
jgi:hypothetical protein